MSAESGEHTGEELSTLERRSGRSRARLRQPAGARESLMVVPWSTFNQVLLKYVRRQARSGRCFCLAAVDILEYARVKEVSGIQAAAALQRAVVEACVNGLRDADRVCTAGGGRLVVLLPESSEQGARRALTRLAQVVAAARIHHHHVKLHASLAFALVDSSGHDPDPEALLAAVGFQAEGGQPAASPVSPLLFRGDCARWLERYDAPALNDGGPGSHRDDVRLGQRLVEASDRWRDGRAVVLRVLTLPAGDSLEPHAVDALAARARALQAADYPGLCLPRDYHIADGRSVFLVYDRPEGLPLGRDTAGPRAGGRQDGIGWERAIAWAVQVCNMLVYLQDLVPPLVPLPLSVDNFNLSDRGSLVLFDFELPYLFPSRHRSAHLSEREAEAVRQGRPSAACVPLIKGLRALLYTFAGGAAPPPPVARLMERLAADPLPRDLDTVYKLRSALKALDSERG